MGVGLARTLTLLCKLEWLGEWVLVRSADVRAAWLHGWVGW